MASSGSRPISTPMPVCWYTRYSSADTVALAAYAMPTQPKTPNRSDSCIGSLRFRRGTAVSSSVMATK